METCSLVGIFSNVVFGFELLSKWTLVFGGEKKFWVQLHLAWILLDIMSIVFQNKCNENFINWYMFYRLGRLMANLVGAVFKQNSLLVWGMHCDFTIVFLWDPYLNYKVVFVVYVAYPFWKCSANHIF